MNKFVRFRQNECASTTLESWRTHHSVKAFARAQKSSCARDAPPWKHSQWISMASENVDLHSEAFAYSPCQGDVVEVVEDCKRQQHAAHHCHQHSRTCPQERNDRLQAWTAQTVTKQLHDPAISCITCRLKGFLRCDAKGALCKNLSNHRLCRNSTTDCGGSGESSSPLLKTLSTSNTLRNSLCCTPVWVTRQ